MRKLFSCLLACSLLVGCAAHKAPQAPPMPPSTPQLDTALQSLHMLDVQNGWAQTYKAVWHTIDAGAHWTNVTPAAAQTNTDGNIINRAFPLDGQRLWFDRMSNTPPDTLFVTQDGGATWAQQRVQTTVLDLTFLDADHGWMLTGGGAAAGMPGPTDVWQTTNGGTTLTKLAEVRPYLPTGIRFRDRQTGWMTNSLRIPSDRLARVELNVTHDGGKTWEIQQLTVPSGLRATDMVTVEPPQFSGRDQGILPVLFGGAEPQACFYLTKDGGATWQSTALLPYTGSRLTYDFLDMDHGWASDGRQVFRTMDGGGHWLVLKPDASLAGLMQLDFVSTKVGWALVQDPTKGDSVRLLKTADGGESWTETTLTASGTPE